MTSQRWCRCSRGLLMVYVAPGNVDHVCPGNNATSGQPVPVYMHPATSQARGASSPPSTPASHYGRPYQSSSPPDIPRSSSFAHEYRGATGGASDEYYGTSQSPPQQNVARGFSPSQSRVDTSASVPRYSSSPPQMPFTPYQAPNDYRSNTAASRYYTADQWPPFAGYAHEGPQQSLQDANMYTGNYSREPDAMPGASDESWSSPPADTQAGWYRCGRCGGKVIK